MWLNLIRLVPRDAIYDLLCWLLLTFVHNKHHHITIYTKMCHRRPNYPASFIYVDMVICGHLVSVGTSCRIIDKYYRRKLSSFVYIVFLCNFTNEFEQKRVCLFTPYIERIIHTVTEIVHNVSRNHIIWPGVVQMNEIYEYTHRNTTLYV